MNVEQICSRPAITVQASATLLEVAELMRDHHVGAIVVTKAPIDQPVAAGIITDRDIVRAQLAHTADLSRLRAEQVMTRDPLVLNGAMSVTEAIQQLRLRGVRRAPVVNSNGALIGMVSTDDLLAYVCDEVVGLAQLVSQQPSREGALSAARDG